MKKLLFIGMLLIGLSLQGWSQEKTITVTGIVTDTEKEPLIGVNISVQDMPGLGVITDINGRYRINVPAYNWCCDECGCGCLEGCTVYFGG